MDDKLVTKAVCRQWGIPVPRTYATVSTHGEIRRIEALIGDYHDFVIKPARGSEGRGIKVIAGRRGEVLLDPVGEHVTLADLRYHLAAILAGLYSLSGQPDRAIIEQRIEPHPLFASLAVGGTPDIRVVVYRGVPAMAMVRIPTGHSGGRANLHQGAVGVGIDLESGETSGGVWLGRIVTRHPDTGRPLAGLRIPHWANLLEAAAALADRLCMAYLGVDFMVDGQHGPLVLEVNARPGLAIQLANRTGLLERLEAIDRGWRLPVGSPPAAPA
ncbi:MAG TPA: alpha-L-glutamate ligase-like protein, partial [Planctomycetaceae bacterium]|nr:alpha-L-glutamate ligase-like protein [Planctomycetaceae bacterium]